MSKNNITFFKLLSFIYGKLMAKENYNNKQK
jgi:hypothetical protein